MPNCCFQPFSHHPHFSKAHDVPSEGTLVMPNWTVRSLHQLAGWEANRKSFRDFDADNSGELCTSEVQAVLEARDADSSPKGGRLWSAVCMVKVGPCLVGTIHEHQYCTCLFCNISFVYSNIPIYTLINTYLKYLYIYISLCVCFDSPAAHLKYLPKIQSSLNHQLCSSDAFIFQVACTRLH